MKSVLGLEWGRPSISKAVKIAVGCSLAVLIARAFGLSTATAVVTITLLSVQRTKKDTLRAALRRSLAFLASLALALPLFYFLQFSVLSLGLFLLLFVPVCQWLDLEEGLAMSTVLMLHVWNAKTIRLALVLNEAALMAIGILMGVVMNAYMPRRTRVIREDQRITEERIRIILRNMGRYLREEDTMNTFPSQIQTDIRGLSAHLDEARCRAVSLADNTFHPDMRYFLQYVEMRRQQCQVLSRLAGSLTRLDPEPSPFPWQATEIGVFMMEVADSLHEYNNAVDLLDHLEDYRRRFKRSELPATRREFEIRAVLYEAADGLQHLLELKRDFVRSLTSSQIEMFWSCPMDRRQRRKE